jgi:uncharacterized peroxidase-related enzyme
MGRAEAERLERQLVLDYREAELSFEDRALCDFAVKLTLTPGEMKPSDIDALREHGFDDEAITIATQVVSYFNYINRIADALGVDNEPWMTMSRDEWLSKKGRDFASVL